MKTIVKDKVDLSQYSQFLLTKEGSIPVIIARGGIGGIGYKAFIDIKRAWPSRRIKAILPDSDKLLDITDLIGNDTDDNTISIKDADVSKGIIAFDKADGIVGYISNYSGGGSKIKMTTLNGSISYWSSLEGLLEYQPNVILKQLK